jgi:hypothetical protein
MFDQLFEGVRKASESTLQAQQDMFKQWVSQIPSAPLSAARISGDWNAAFQKRFIEMITEALTKHREFLDTAYRSGIDVMQHCLRVSDAKSPEEFRKLTEELWRKLSETFKEQSEAGYHELQRTADRWLELAKQVPG